MKTKTFDCVEMKREAAKRINEELKGKSVEEQIAYWRRIEEERAGSPLTSSPPGFTQKPLT